MRLTDACGLKSRAIGVEAAASGRTFKNGDKLSGPLRSGIRVAMTVLCTTPRGLSKVDTATGDSRSTYRTLTESNPMRTLTREDTDAAHLIEDAAAKVPSDTFMWLAGGSIAASLTLKLLGRDRDAVFVGQWAPTFIALALYNKLSRSIFSD